MKYDKDKIIVDGEVFELSSINGHTDPIWIYRNGPWDYKAKSGETIEKFYKRIKPIIESDVKRRHNLCK